MACVAAIVCKLVSVCTTPRSRFVYHHKSLTETPESRASTPRSNPKTLDSNPLKVISLWGNRVLKLLAAVVFLDFLAEQMSPGDVQGGSWLPAEGPCEPTFQEFSWRVLAEQLLPNALH